MIEAINGIIQDPWSFLINTLFSEFIAVVVGMAFVILVRDRWVQFRYGKWHVVVKDAGKVYVDRPISASKAKSILEEPAELSVFLKGVVSPYRWIRCDLIEQGKKCGLLVIDKKNRRFIIDLDQAEACESEFSQSVNTTSTP